MQYFICFLCSIILLSACHYEKRLFKTHRDGAVKESHTIITTPITDRKLEVELKKSVLVAESPAINFSSLNYNRFSDDFVGMVNFQMGTDGIIGNLIYDSRAIRNDTLTIEGTFSVNNKRTFEELELRIPMAVFDQYKRIDTTNSVINIENLIKVGLLVENTVSDSISDGESLNDTVSTYFEVIYESTDSVEQKNRSATINNLVTIDSLKSPLKNDVVNVDIGSIKYQDNQIRFVSLSDPLPLIPIAIGIVATALGYDIYNTQKKKREKEKMTVIVEKRK
jgi:hypothetical protein